MVNHNQTFEFRYLLVATAICLISPAFAQGTKAERPSAPLTGTPEQRAACGPDVGKLCKNVKAVEGTGAYVSCLVDNYEKLSEACRNVLDKEIK